MYAGVGAMTRTGPHQYNQLDDVSGPEGGSRFGNQITPEKGGGDKKLGIHCPLLMFCLYVAYTLLMIRYRCTTDSKM